MHLIRGAIRGKVLWVTAASLFLVLLWVQCPKEVFIKILCDEHKGASYCDVEGKLDMFFNFFFTSKNLEIVVFKKNNSFFLTTKMYSPVKVVILQIYKIQD